MKTLEVYLSDDAWAYNGTYQKIGDLPGVKDTNEKLWTMLGALLLELLGANVLDVVIYNDTRLVEEWSEQIKFQSTVSKAIAVQLKNHIAKKFLKLSIKKLDRFNIDSKIKNLQLL